MHAVIAGMSSNASAIRIVLPDPFQFQTNYHIVPEIFYPEASYASPLGAQSIHGRNAVVVPILSDNRPDILNGPISIPAVWLPDVERRIRESTSLPDTRYVDDGQCLNADIAHQAQTFFRQTSDVLPSEPYIYASRQGDLVAEFRTRRGSMTSIIGRTSIITFTVIDGALAKLPQFTNENLTIARGILQGLTKTLLTDPDGAMDSEK